MTANGVESMPEAVPASRAGRVVRILVGAIFLVVGTWVVFGAYTGNEVRECSTLYAAARTAADTTRIDLTVTPAAKKRADPRSCGSMRIAGRWQ